MKAGRSRRRPYPYDVTIGGVTGITGDNGFMLGRKEKGAALIAKDTPHLTNVQPSEFSYAAHDPHVEQTFVWDDWSLGFGLANQRTQNDRRYYYAYGADASIRGQIMPGPEINYITPTDGDTTNGITHFFDIDGATYALNGRYLKKRTADNAAGWATNSIDFGAGNVALDVAITKQNDASSTKYAYIALGDGAGDYIYRWDGTTATQHTSLQALAFCVVGRELYRAHSTNLVAKVDTNSDPWDPLNWTAANSYRVGDNTSAIVRMAVNAAGILLIFKTDGIYILDEDGNDIKLFPGLGIIPNSDNGKAFCNYEDFTYVVYNDQMFRISAGLEIEHVGPERAVENDQVVKGYVTSCVGTPFCLYTGVRNRDTNRGYLFKFGAWVPTNDEDQQYRRIDAWHGDISDGFASARYVSALGRSSIGASSGHDRLYIGMSQGQICYFPLPCTANPANCTDYRFDPDGALVIYFPTWNGGYPVDVKHVRSAAITGKNLSSTVGLHLSEGISGQYLPGSSVDDAFTATASRKDLDVDTTYVRARFGLEAAAGQFTYSQTVPLIIHSVSVQFAIRPPRLMQWEMALLCENSLQKRDGTIMRIGAERIRTVAQAAVDTYGSCTFYLADESNGVQLSVIDSEEGYAWDDSTEQWRAAIFLKCIETAKGNEVLIT